MTEPLSNRPKITTNDIRNGYVIRYFAKHISMSKIIEIDKIQYDKLQLNTLYIILKLKWIINGFANNKTAKNENTIYGASYQNSMTVKFAEQKMPGIANLLRNRLEYFQGLDNNTE